MVEIFCTFSKLEIPVFNIYSQTLAFKKVGRILLCIFVG